MNDGDFEKQLKKLQKIVSQLEAGDLPLEKGVTLFKEGLALAGSCRKQLEQAKIEVSVLSQDVRREPQEGESDDAEE